MSRKKQIFRHFCFPFNIFFSRLKKTQSLYFADCVFLSAFQNNTGFGCNFRSRDLKDIDELNRIKKSVSNELREMENKRNQIQVDSDLV